MDKQTTATLPNDIVIAFATQLKSTCPTSNDLFSFTLVNRQWHQFGLRILYGNIALNKATLERFANALSPTHAKLIRSLTLNIEPDRGIHPKATIMLPGLGSASFLMDAARLDFSEAEDDGLNDTPLPRQITRIVDLIPQLTNLTSFSLRLADSAWRSIPRATIARLLHDLPESCINLELDTRGQDHREEDEQVHVCDAIRRILPRMQNFRVRIGAMCSGMFGAMTEKDGKGAWKPVTLSNIQSLIVNCGTGSGQMIQLCGQKDYTSSAKNPEWPAGIAWTSIATGLQHLVRYHAIKADGSKIYAMAGTSPGISIHACQTNIRVDMLLKEAWAFPILRLGRPFGGSSSYLMRLDDGSDIIAATETKIEEAAEGHIWRETVGSLRLPASTLDLEKYGRPSFASGCVEQPIESLTIDQWNAEHPTEPMSTLLRNEMKTSTQLVRAEKRVGHDYRSLRPVREVIPEGWARINHTDELERI